MAISKNVNESKVHSFHNERRMPFGSLLWRMSARLPPNPRVAPKEEKHGRSPLTPEQVRDIRSSTASVKEIADKYGMKVSSIKNIRAGINYAWVI